MGSGGGRRVGVDTGGTFTDVVDESGAHVKVLSDRADPACGGATRSRRSGRRGRRARARHDRRDEHVARAGRRPRRARDERGLRGPHRDRSAGSSVAVRPVGRPSRRRSCLGHCATACRDGSRSTAPSSCRSMSRGCPSLPPEIETVAVCFLHADRWPAHEEAVVAALEAMGPTPSRRTTSRPSTASTSGSSPPWSTCTCDRRAATTSAGSPASRRRCSS